MSVQRDNEPDYRFTLANERTFLAWMRTSLGLLAGGAAVIHLMPGMGPTVVRLIIGIALLAAALAVAAAGYRYYRLADAAIRAGRALPRHHMPLALAAVVGLTALVVVVLAIAG